MSTIVLVTGANTGLGYEIVRALYHSPKSYTILLGGRSLDKADKAAAAIREEKAATSSEIATVQIDIESDDSINALHALVESKYGKVDVLINNAGAQFDSAFNQGQLGLRESWLKAWDVNVAGTQVLTHTFVPLLLKSQDPRLIFMASGTSSLAGTDNPKLPVNKSVGPGWPKKPEDLKVVATSYRSAKAGLNMLMREWTRFLKEDGVKIWAVSPGMLATGLVGEPSFMRALGAPEPSVGGEFVKKVVEGERDADVGKVINKDGIQAY